ncbi:arsenic ABC transporter ATPase [Ureibacillus massiliensis 4400831 = CIP 108448 = CCUG 49529]|uniref:Arsenic ABC transporter ATPase n=1 Tax=Ureibacillus massiliensis 4400831 = CIP 108448 = CCUG 49529 TaxID=1211035 RepID=A0A0A3J273_9BACL|nr:arsenical pump-driving ATPase [Ureibacillus massiliensis]KGR89770.1 arsenic ABC transporter ATPase [Ureibacillus massiliensis 4400831 = CIP 108448 = CCUG 49529]BDH63576.1 arsenical pump-driving ATPase [Lysinibacillus sp. PLM2]
MERFTIEHFPKTPFLFFTGKGGVGKTSVASSLSISMANEGKKVLLISTDPASNLQDIFNQTLYNTPTKIEGAENLYALNLDPELAAQKYKEQMVGPYRGKLPEVVLQNMEEQLSGACTVEIAAFNEFAQLLTNPTLIEQFDTIVFDTAPTGHTLRLLQLPSAWSTFLDENTTGTSCLGPLKGLEPQREMYKKAVSQLTNAAQTALILVTRPETNPLKEAARASHELYDIGIQNQIVLINGYMQNLNQNDDIEQAFINRQSKALEEMPEQLQSFEHYYLPFVPYSLSSIELMQAWITDEEVLHEIASVEDTSIPKIEQMIMDYLQRKPKLIFTMGKGGVGKTTVASYIALRLAEEGLSVHLTTTDPAAHLNWTFGDETVENLTVSRIDPKVEVSNYEAEVLAKASETMNEEGLAFVKEDLASPCTEEIAVFRAFANVVEDHQDEIIIIDTAPTGHTLLLLDATESYHREISRSQGDIPASVSNLLPRLRDANYTSVAITTLSEATPVYEATRLQEDLKRAGLSVDWWIVNQSFTTVSTTSKILKQKQQSESKWLQEIQLISKDRYVTIPWVKTAPLGIKGLHQLKGELIK